MANENYRVDRDGLELLALPDGLEQAVRAALDEPEGDHLRAAIDTAISAKVAKYGISSDGEFLGEWSAEEIVRDIMVGGYRGSDGLIHVHPA